MTDISRVDVDALKARLPDHHVEWHATLASTNDRALESARNCESAPRLIVAQHQSSGRGRGENSWWSAAGSLTFSLVVDAESMNLPITAWPLASLATGLAVCQTMEAAAAGAPLSIKWPNDVFLGERKLAGILMETTPSPRRLIAGVGINVNNRFAKAPADLRQRSTSMHDFFDRPFDIAELLIKSTQMITRQIRQAANDTSPIIEGWRERCLLSDRQVEIELHGQVITGKCLGIDDDGALVVVDDNQRHTIVAGQIKSWT